MLIGWVLIATVSVLAIKSDIDGGSNMATQFRIEADDNPWVRVNSCVKCGGALAQETESAWIYPRLYCLNCGSRFRLNGEPDSPDCP